MGKTPRCSGASVSHGNPLRHWLKCRFPKKPTSLEWGLEICILISAQVMRSRQIKLRILLQNHFYSTFAHIHMPSQAGSPSRNSSDRKKPSSSRAALPHGLSPLAGLSGCPAPAQPSGPRRQALSVSAFLPARPLKYGQSWMDVAVGACERWGHAMLEEGTPGPGPAETRETKAVIQETRVRSGKRWGEDCGRKLGV